MNTRFFRAVAALEGFLLPFRDAEDLRGTSRRKEFPFDPGEDPVSRQKCHREPGTFLEKMIQNAVVGGEIEIASRDPVHGHGDVEFSIGQSVECPFEFQRTGVIGAAFQRDLPYGESRQFRQFRLDLSRKQGDLPSAGEKFPDGPHGVELESAEAEVFEESESNFQGDRDSVRVLFEGKMRS